MKLELTHNPSSDRPTNASWLAKAKISPEGNLVATPYDDSLDADPEPDQEVEVAWYKDGVIKLTLPKGAPMTISQVYLTGTSRDVIIELTPNGE
jgi:hypothetical protein